MFCYSGALLNNFFKFLELSWTRSVEIALNSSPGNSEPRVWPVITGFYSKGYWGKVVLGAHTQAHCRFLRLSDGREPSSILDLSPSSIPTATVQVAPSPSCAPWLLEVVLWIQEFRLRSLSSKTWNMMHYTSLFRATLQLSYRKLSCPGEARCNRKGGSSGQESRSIHSLQA